TVTPPVDLPERARRRHRTRVRLLTAAAAAAAVLVGIGVPAGLTLVRADAPPARPEPGPSPASCEPLSRPQQPTASAVPADQLPRPTGVRGSLAGDRALVDAVLVAGWQGLRDSQEQLDKTPGGRRTLDVRTLRLRFVERAGPGVLALVTAADTTGEWQAAQWVVRERGEVRPTGGPGGIVTDESFERRLGQLFSGEDPLLISTVDVCGGQYGVVLAPPDATARLSPPPTVGANARPVPAAARPLPLRDGLAVFPLPTAAEVTVYRGGSRVGSARVGTGLIQSADYPIAAIDRAIREAPGEVDDVLARSALPLQADHLQRAVPDPVTRVRILWGGRLRTGKPVLLAAFPLPSGATFVSAAEELPGTGSGYNTSYPYEGLLPAGRLDGTVLGWQSGQDVVLVAPRAVRAEVVLPGGAVLPVPLTEGGGRVTVPKGVQAQLLRAYAANGGLIDQRAPGTGLLPLPGS
ncbi:MAG TPA: hypothetical protein VE547_20345, partial [Mycobacteriales bacterium]|nr:hypothetical protein [Mycobacteriales bacterium]